MDVLVRVRDPGGTRGLGHRAPGEERQPRRDRPQSLRRAADEEEVQSSDPSAVPTSCATSNSGWGTIPKKIVPAAASTATNRTSGWARASASGDQPDTDLTQRGGTLGTSISSGVIHITAITRR